MQPPVVMQWVEIVSLGKVARSTINTRSPAFASNRAVEDPAQRAPTTMASYPVSLISALPVGLAVRVRAYAHDCQAPAE